MSSSEIAAFENEVKEYKLQVCIQFPLSLYYAVY